MIEEELESSTELLIAVAKYTYDDVSVSMDLIDWIVSVSKVRIS